MRRAYLVLVGLLMLAITVQFYLAAVGAFDKPQDDGSFSMHRMNGMMIIPVVSVVATVVGALARVPGRLVGLTILPVGLVVFQVLLTEVGERLAGSTDDHTTPGALAFLGLHAIVGMSFFAVAGVILRQARAL